MAHIKNHGPAPVPPGNRPSVGPTDNLHPAAHQGGHEGGGAPLQEEDAKRRLGDFTTEGEHSRQQPGAINDGDKHSR